MAVYIQFVIISQSVSQNRICKWSKITADFAWNLTEMSWGVKTICREFEQIKIHTDYFR